MPTHQTNTHIVTALFEDMTGARRLVQALRRRGVPDDDLSVVSSGRHYGEDRYRDIDQKILADDKHYAEDAAGAGATLGGAGGFLVGLGTVTVPGAGPLLVIGGVLASTITGAALGGAAGGLIGLLVDLGVPKERARLYETGLTRGHVLVAVKSGPELVSEVADLVARHGPIDLEQRMDVWERDQMLDPTPKT